MTMRHILLFILLCAIRVSAADGEIQSIGSCKLMSLPGVGAVTTNRIIEGRTGGPYQSADDLLRVKGISRKSLEAMAPSLRFQKSSGGDAPKAR